MKKLVFFSVFALICSLSKAQDLSYGFLVGANYHDLEIKNSSGSIDSKISDRPNIQIGGFIGYQFSDKLGIKANTQYNRLFQKYSYSSQTSVTHSINAFEFIPQLKFNPSPRFYFLAGPRFSFIITAEENGEDIKDFYKSTLIGAQLGLGFTPVKILSIEFIGDYGFSDISDFDPVEIKTLGGYLNFVFNLDAILKK